jgi:hypothetical protein
VAPVPLRAAEFVCRPAPRLSQKNQQRKEEKKKRRREEKKIGFHANAPQESGTLRGSRSSLFSKALLAAGF